MRRFGLKPPEGNEPRFLDVGANMTSAVLHQFCEPNPSSKTYDVI